jgi:hypothetical protein
LLIETTDDLGIRIALLPKHGSGERVSWATAPSSSAVTNAERAARLLALPQFTRVTLLGMGSPGLRSEVLDGWVRDGVIDWDRQMAAGDARTMRAITASLDANRRRRPQDRLYTGGDVIKVMVAQAVSEARLPERLVRDILPLALEAALYRVMEPAIEAELAVAVLPDGSGGYLVRPAAHSADPGTAGRTIVDVDAMVGRYLAAVDALEAHPD